MHELMQSMLDLIRNDKRYRLEAYQFVFEALHYAQSTLGLGRYSESQPHESDPLSKEEQGPQRHVTGQELCEAIRRYAAEQYGFMAKIVLNSWGIRSTGDFGEIVFNLIRIGRMRKTEHDRREDFDNVYDFDAAFRQDFHVAPE